MRIVAVFVMRVFVDDAAPGRLCGTLQTVDGEKKLAFHDAESVLARLKLAIETRSGSLSGPLSAAALDNNPDDQPT